MNRFQLGRIGAANECASIRPTLHDCVQAVLQVADTLVQEMLDGLASMTSGNAFNNSFACQFPVNKAMTDLLCCQAPSVTRTFVAQLEIGICSAPQDLADGLAVHFLDLQRLNIEQIDASIEFGLVLQEVSRCVDDVLPTVNALVSSLSGWTRVQSHLNPVKTDVFVRALLASLSLHVPERSVRAALLIPAAGLLGVSLRKFYRELSDWLLSQGVEPSWPAGERLASETSVSAKVRNDSVDRRLAILDKFRRLLCGEAESGSRSSGTPDFLPTVPFSYTALEDLNLIKPMMQRLVERENQCIRVGKKQDVADAVIPDEPMRGRDLSKALGEAALSLMLDSLLQDKKLLPGVGELTRRLEPALLRLARSDPRFFSDHQHPARRLLAWLSQHGRASVFQSEQQCDRFITLVASAISDLQRSDAGAALFALVLRSLEHEWAHEATRQHSADGLVPH